MFKDIVYAAEKKLKLDIYPAVSKKTAPVLIWFHGGGMTMNTKEVWEVADFGKRFSGEGFVVVAPDYRKSPHVKYPVYVEDAAEALAWVFNNITKYSGDNSRIFVGGHSAGAYLAAMIAMAPQFLSAQNLNNKDIAGIILVSGQLDTHQRVREERNIKDEGFFEDDAAPWHYISPNLPPILVMAAEKDLPGRANINRQFVNALYDCGHNRSEFIEIPGREHVSIIEDILKPEAPVGKFILEFIHQYSN